MLQRVEGKLAVEEWDVPRHGVTCRRPGIAHCDICHGFPFHESPDNSDPQLS